MNLERDISFAEGGIRAALFDVALQGQARAQERRYAIAEAQSDANAVAAVNRLSATLRAARRREAELVAALRETKAALARAQGALIRLTA